MPTSIDHASRSPSPPPQPTQPGSPSVIRDPQPSRAEPVEIPCMHVEVAPTLMSCAEALDTFCACTGRHVIASAMQRFKAEEQGLSRVDATSTQLHREQNAFASNVQSRLSRAATLIHRARAEWRAANGPPSYDATGTSVPPSRALSRPSTQQRSASPPPPPPPPQMAQPQPQDQQQLESHHNQISPFRTTSRPALQIASGGAQEQQDRSALKRGRDQNTQKPKNKSQRSRGSSRARREVD